MIKPDNTPRAINISNAGFSLRAAKAIISDSIISIKILITGFTLIIKLFIRIVFIRFACSPTIG